MAKYIIGVRLDDARPYYCVSSQEMTVGSKAVVGLDDNIFLGSVVSSRPARDDENIGIYANIVRSANAEDESASEENKRRELSIVSFVQKSADELKLKMNVFRAYSSLDRTKVRIMYTSDERVDFRGLLKILAPEIHARIEMRQVGPRDKAKMIGGLGICGLKLCCSSFLTAFEGISISMAKNQMLAINIPKLSGQCGKLICCLKYEDLAYQEAKKDYPRMGQSVTLAGASYKVSNINVLNRTLTLYGSDGYKTMTLEEYDNAVNNIKPAEPKRDSFLPPLAPAAADNANQRRQTEHADDNRAGADSSGRDRTDRRPGDSSRHQPNTGYNPNSSHSHKRRHGHH